MKQAKGVRKMTIFTRHFIEDRGDRFERIRKEIGFGKLLKVEYIDNHHRNGAEIHYITDTGVIFVKNARTHKMVTIEVVAVHQLKKYWEDALIPVKMLEIARQHERIGANYW